MALVCLRLISSRWLEQPDVRSVKSDQLGHPQNISTNIFGGWVQRRIKIQRREKVSMERNGICWLAKVTRWPDREWSRRRILKNIMKEEKFGVRYRCWCWRWCWCWRCQSSESDRWSEKGGWRDGSTQLSRPGDVFVQNFFLIGPSPANLYAPHPYFYTTRLKNAALLDLTIGARVEFLRDLL